MPDPVLDYTNPDSNILPLTPEEPQIPEQYQELFDFTLAKPRIQKLVGLRFEAVEACKARRKERYVDLNVLKLRETGEILEDETLIPVRVIDSNIKQELPDSMAFLNANFRLAIFHPLENPNTNPRNLEFEFTRVLTYTGWNREILRTFDGSKLHAWDALEVVFDSSKPGHVAFEHVGYDRLYFNTGVSNIQDSEILLREYDVTLMNLWSFITDHNFNPDQVNKLCPADSAGKTKRDSTVKIFKYYFKYNKTVYVGWLALEGGCTDWLCAPQPLRLGIFTLDVATSGFKERDIDQYPIFLRIDKDDEQELIDAKKGRGFLDGPQQEATTALTSSFVNGTARASNVFAAPDVDDPDSTEVKLIDLQLVPGGIYNVPMKFWSPPYPEVTLLSGLQYLATLNSAQTGKLAAAVSNRKDARKTAEELSQAKSAEDKITSVTQQSDSEFLREVFSFAWLIVQSQALQDKIDFLKIPSGVGAFANDKQTIGQLYEIRPAGDTDIIEAENKIQKMQQDWPVVQAFPGLKDIFIEDFIRARYPKDADRYVQALKQGNPALQFAQSLSALATNMAQQQKPEQINEQERMQLQQMAQQANAYIQQQTQPQQ